MLDPDQFKLLNTQFEQDWLHIRHLENQLWRLFGFFITLNAATLAAIAAIVSGKIVWQEMIGSLSLAFTLLISGWGYFVLRIFLKWRKEFVLHFYDLNKIRAKGFKIYPNKFTIWRLDKAPLIKLSSVFFYACCAVIVTVATVSSAFYYMATIGFNVVDNLGFSTMFFGSFIGLFLFEDLIWNSFQAAKEEDRTTLFQFDKKAFQEKKRQALVVKVFIFLETLWIAFVLICGVLVKNLLFIQVFCALFFTKILVLNRPTWAYLRRMLT